MHNTVGQH